MKNFLRFWSERQTKTDNKNITSLAELINKYKKKGNLGINVDFGQTKKKLPKYVNGKNEFWLIRKQG